MKALKSAIKWIAAIAIICAVAVFLASINGLMVARKMGTVGGVEFTEAEFKYHLYAAKTNMLSEATQMQELDTTNQDAVKAFWDTEVDGKKNSDAAKESAKESLIEVNALYAKAQQEGISLTEEEMKSIAVAFDGLDATQLQEMEKEIGAKKDQMVKFLEKEQLASKYTSQLAEQEKSPIAVTDEEAVEYMNGKYVRVKHILIANTPTQDPVYDENGNEVVQPELTEEELAAYKEDAKKTADDVLAKVKSGADFEALMDEYTADSQKSADYGYVFDETGASYDGSGAMVEPFTKGSFALQVGEASAELVESDYGWHIIKRYPLEQEAVAEETAEPAEGEVATETVDTYTQVLEAAKMSKQNEKLEAFIDELVAKTEVTLNEKIYNKAKVK